MAQMMLTKAIAKKLPKMYSTEHINAPDKKIIVKYFTPWTSWTWYAAEYDPEERRFFGYVDNGRDGEWGYFSLDELESVKGPWGLKIERDYHFGPTKFSEINH